MRYSCNKALKRTPALTALLLALCLVISSCSGPLKPKAIVKSSLDYSDKNLWVFLNEGGEKDADCCLICPTVYISLGRDKNMSVKDPAVRTTFTGTLNSEKGVFSGSCAMYAPVYRQAAIEVYNMEGSESEQYFDIAYADVERAFLYYIQKCNHGRPLILAGFSQGADMCIRLLKDHGDDPKVRKVLTACYAIGWRISDEDVSKYPHLKTAQGEDDTGVIITFDCEAEDVKTSLVVPSGTKTRSINPLNWKTDTTPADKSLNKGSIMNDGRELAHLTGCYIDPERGTLKVTDIAKGDYPPGPSCFSEGEYHIYDINLFYRNLIENVEVRLKAFKAADIV